MKDAGINGFQEMIKKSQESAPSAKARIGIGRKNKLEVYTALLKIFKVEYTNFFMELLKDKLKRELIKGTTFVDIRALISRTNWINLSVTSLCGSPLTLNLIDKDFKLRFQTLTSGINGFQEGNFRIDNHYKKPIHTHFQIPEENLKFENNLSPIILGNILQMILGSEYKEIEESLK